MDDFHHLRRQMVQRYKNSGYIKSEAMYQAMLKVPREKFMAKNYIKYSYVDQPFPIPGDGKQTISAPYMYPIFYEPLDLKEGKKVLEVGAGSGYGAALAKELVGPTGTVVTIEINSDTYLFARENLKKAGYGDVILLLGDGSLGYAEEAPYDAICITAASPEIPSPIINQLNTSGKIMAPVGKSHSLFGQDLVLLEKDSKGRTKTRTLMKVSYVPLTGKYGWQTKGMF